MERAIARDEATLAKTCTAFLEKIYGRDRKEQ